MPKHTSYGVLPPRGAPASWKPPCPNAWALNLTQNPEHSWKPSVVTGVADATPDLRDQGKNREDVAVAKS